MPPNLLPAHAKGSRPADYYTKTLAGGPANQRGVAANRVPFRRASATLRRFDLVLIVEGVGQPDYDAWWARRLGLDPDTRMPHRNRTTQQQSLYDIRDHLTENLRRDAATRNRCDLELYQAARTSSPVPLAGVSSLA